MKDTKLKSLVMKSLHQPYELMSQKSPYSCLTNDQSPAIFVPSSLPQYSIKGVSYDYPNCHQIQLSSL